ncbi:MAG: hypothetical protein OIF32_11325 [Campylobacterales bacterium]|nr:hypothetical protein [Campylobacterales bacterium]
MNSIKQSVLAEFFEVTRQTVSSKYDEAKAYRFIREFFTQSEIEEWLKYGHIRAKEKRDTFLDELIIEVFEKRLDENIELPFLYALSQEETTGDMDYKSFKKEISDKLKTHKEYSFPQNLDIKISNEEERFWNNLTSLEQYILIKYVVIITDLPKGFGRLFDSIVDNILPYTLHNHKIIKTIKKKRQ